MSFSQSQEWNAACMTENCSKFPKELFASLAAAASLEGHDQENESFLAHKVCIYMASLRVYTGSLQGHAQHIPEVAL